MLRTSLAFSLGLILFLAACGGGGGSTPPPPAVSVALTPSTAQTINAGLILPIGAAVSNDSANQGVTWSLTGVGSLAASSITSVTYQAPGTVSSDQTATVTATSIANPAVSASLQITVTNTTASGNVVPLIVDGGPAPLHNYANGVFTTVTICLTGTPTCQAIGGILVDTGSFGLRVLKSALAVPPSPLPISGKTLNNCAKFVDGSFLWGEVAAADIQLGGEKATNTSFQIIADPTTFTIPTACSSGGSNIDNLGSLGANGILGVGPEAQDCGPACASGTPPPVYFACSSGTTCTATLVPLAQQITNPVVKFPTDNNGVIMEMQSLTSAATTATGSLIFGIGTQTNNGLAGAKIQTMDNFDNFTTLFNGQTMTESFIDSGSNGLFFPDSGIPNCPDAAFFFCPSSLLSLSAINQGQNSAVNTVSFGIDNADNLFNNNPTADAFSTLGGTNDSGSFDWGLPFFYGRSVFTSIRGQTTPSGTPPAPWWAY